MQLSFPKVSISYIYTDGIKIMLFTDLPCAFLLLESALFSDWSAQSNER